MEFPEIENIIREDFDRFVHEECVPTLKACAAAHIKDNRNGLVGSIRADKINEDVYWVGTHCGHGAVVNNGRKEVTPLGKNNGGKDVLKFRDESYHMYSSAFEGYHFVEEAVAKLGGS